jgi:hypothetical protein
LFDECVQALAGWKDDDVYIQENDRPNAGEATNNTDEDFDIDEICDIGAF